MKKGVKVFLIVAGLLSAAVAIAATWGYSWYRSVVPKQLPPTPMPRADLPWSDDFSDPASGWQTESDATAHVAYHDGTMRIFVESPNRLAWAFAGHDFADFRLAVEATQAAGPDNNEYGVLVRIQDNANFYRFSISGDGYYQVSKHTQDGLQLLTAEWPQSEAIHTGQATNHLLVVCRGETMTFFVNDVQLAQVTDADFHSGDIGLYAGTFYESGVDVRFDDLSITQP